ncbi:16S rRNA (cytidine(1402)-2'-O)-methyltransferase [Oribacterium sp. WCC10]|uniref:16S rRNA (cytidine(1402)-2'-O)-methyltransferase n=1 Tax=Oribacterium sp. WCC10 TaxID=1855343 RepID=UPI0008E4C3C4|nr:16S rRNA (cytidine(1402)-2'-O)-methyltransferase [Oribacterium sp. WCC10]SFG12856.1 16S rRNA (cytidine1402-2'-O)-methyltransferase [Oribacterium sp. WCC10]
MSGTLYVCATPIGNLEDITYRVINCLKSVDVIAAEDTRNSIKLLNHFDIHTPMTAYHEFNKYDKAKTLVNDMLNGKNVAIITDAGTPCISDPGEELVHQAAEAGITITSLPGPAAAITALTISALPTRRFAFEAFLPTEKADKKERTRILEELRTETRTMILYEAPHKLKATLKDLAKTLGEDRRISLCRELTKKHEEAIRTTLAEAITKYESEDPRGEYVLVIEGRSPEDIAAENEANWNEMPVEEHMEHYLGKGMSEKDAMKAVARDRGVSKRDIYTLLKT